MRIAFRRSASFGTRSAMTGSILSSRPCALSSSRSEADMRMLDSMEASFSWMRLYSLSLSGSLITM